MTAKNKAALAELHASFDCAQSATDALKAASERLAKVARMVSRAPAEPAKPKPKRRRSA